VGHRKRERVEELSESWSRGAGRCVFQRFGGKYVQCIRIPEVSIQIAKLYQSHRWQFPGSRKTQSIQKHGLPQIAMLIKKSDDPVGV
jgi:hypothetical protein